LEVNCFGVIRSGGSVAAWKLIVLELSQVKLIVLELSQVKLIVLELSEVVDRCHRTYCH